MKNILNCLTFVLLSLLSTLSMASSVDFIDCVLSGDAAQYLVRVMNTQKGGEEEKLDHWKKSIASANLNEQVTQETVESYLANHPTKTLPIAMEAVKSCTNKTLKQYNQDHAPFCYGIANASQFLLLSKQQGKSPSDVQKQARETDIPGASREKTLNEIMIVVAEIYSFIPRNTPPDAYKINYFERCLKGEGSAYSSVKKM